MTESAIQKEIMDYARDRGYQVYRMNSGQARHNVKLHEAGTPDLLVLLPMGRSIWVEVKREGQWPTEVQKEMHKRMRGLGHAVTVARSVEEFIEAVREMEV